MSDVESVSKPLDTTSEDPEDSSAVETVSVSIVELRRMRLFAAFLGLVCVGFGIGLAYTLPRSNAYTRVIDENLALKERLDDIETRMGEVDQVLLRLRLYDSQLRSLSPKGDHGPADTAPVDASNEDENGDPLPTDTESVFLAEEGAGFQEPGVRDASEWATSLSDRVDTALSRLERTEPNLSDLVVELEDLRSLEAALPNRWPSRGALTSGYGWRRNPVGVRGYKFHSGLDIANKPGTRIRASADGVVIRAAYNSGYGRQVVIDHGYGITTSYSHCLRLYVREGDRVTGGQKIASMGSTGKSTGPHLHYEVHLDGNAVDPMNYVPRSRPKP